MLLCPTLNSSTHTHTHTHRVFLGTDRKKIIERLRYEVLLYSCHLISSFLLTFSASSLLTSSLFKSLFLFLLTLLTLFLLFSKLHFFPLLFFTHLTKSSSIISFYLCSSLTYNIVFNGPQSTLSLICNVNLLDFFIKQFLDYALTFV